MKLLAECPFLTEKQPVRLYEFDNGLRALLLKDSSAKVIAYQTWFRVGSRTERPGITGIAHLFEHLMFNETEHLAAGEFDRLIELQGGHTNAATSVDFTYYQSDGPSECLEQLATFESDRMAHLVLRTPQLESEREVVMNERRFCVEDDIDGFLSERLFELAFQVHPYHYPVIGLMNDIRSISLEDAQTFYRTYYAPNNATVVLVGDFEEQKALDLLSQKYGPISPSIIPKEQIQTEPPQTSERWAVYYKAVQSPKVIFGYKSTQIGTREHLHLQMCSDLLLGNLSSPLFQDLVMNKELATFAQAGVMPSQHPGLFEIQVALRRGKSISDVQACVEEHIARMQDVGPTEAELERAKAKRLTSFYQGLRTAHGKAELLGEYETLLSDPFRAFSWMEDYRSIEIEDVRKTASAFLNNESRTTVCAMPQSSGESSL